MPASRRSHLISLVVATVSRTVELDRLLRSLDGQTYSDFEVIVVDQNRDDRIVPVLARHGDLGIVHVRSQPGLSRARNEGLARATGAICAVPDDDCWYPHGLLAAVRSWFQRSNDFDVLLGSVRDDVGNLQGPRRRTYVARECDRHSIWHYGTSINAFWRRSVVDSVGGFEEVIGAGAQTKFQSGEETDYFLRALAYGHRVWFEPSMSVFHPSLRLMQRIREQAYPYALGTGYVLRKHGYSVCTLAKDFLAYSLGGALVSLLKADAGVAHVRLLRGLGQLNGYVLAGKYLRKVNTLRTSRNTASA